jgi:hypothetical protein
MTADKAQEAANFLASMPRGHTTLSRVEAQKLMIDTGGQILCQGHLYEIKLKSLGAGVYRASLKETDDDR